MSMIWLIYVRLRGSKIILVLLIFNKILIDNDWKLSIDVYKRQGQAAVFYDGDICLGGGTIETVYKDGKPIEYL